MSNHGLYIPSLLLVRPELRQQYPAIFLYVVMVLFFYVGFPALAFVCFTYHYYNKVFVHLAGIAEKIIDKKSGNKKFKFCTSF